MKRLPGFVLLRRATATLALAILALSSFAALPLDQREARPDEWGYRPADGSVVRSNPPSFTWLVQAKAASYAVQWSRDRAFSPATTTTIDGIVWPTYTHNAAVSPGSYFWRYRYANQQGEVSDWSIARQVEIATDAIALPMPTRAEQRAAIPSGHPRLFMRPEDLPRLRALAVGGEAKAFAALRRTADAYIKAGPTAEPEHKGSARDKNNAELVKYWWPNRVQTEKACEEAEVIAFVYLMTGDATYGEAARRWVLHLASWDPKGNTNFTLNCEAGKPMLFRPARP